MQGIDFTIEKLILHILDNTIEIPVLSECDMVLLGKVVKNSRV